MTTKTTRTAMPPLSRGRWNRPQQLSWVLVSALFVVAFLLRAWGARFGLPEYIYHPDEHAIVDRAAAILRTGDYSPHWFNYPSAYVYLQALSYVPYFLISAARGFGNTVADPAPYGFYFAGRLMTAFFGALTVPLVYAVGSRSYGRRAGLLSSALLTFCLLHVVHSHYVTTDVPAAFLVTLSVLFCALVIHIPKTRYTLLAGLFAGLAASTKYPAAVAFMPVLVAQLLAPSAGQRGTLAQRLGLSLATFAGGFLLGTPYAVLELNTFLSSLASVVGHYGASQPGFEGGNTWLWYLRETLTSADVVIVALGLAGVLWASAKRRRGDLLLLSFLVPYYLLISLWRVRFERNLVALLPLLMVLAARLMVDTVSWLRTSWQALRRWELPLLACVAAVAVLMPARAILDFDKSLAQRDHRTLAAEWVNANLPAGSKIVTEAFSIPLDEGRFQVTQLVRIDSEDLEWYKKEGIQFVIVSDGHWRVLLGQPQKYAREIKTYNEILSHSVILQEFAGDAPPSLQRGYPTIAIYHFPDLLILRLGQVPDLDSRSAPQPRHSCAFRLQLVNSRYSSLDRATQTAPWSNTSLVEGIPHAQP
jgi:4-amino-4-deoxy-L-arabinose transferase-like glycosyltransferase